MQFVVRKLNRMYPCIADFMESWIPKIRNSRFRQPRGKMPVWGAFVVACGAEEELAGRSLEYKALRYARRALAPDGGLRVSVTETQRRGAGLINGYYDTGTNTFYIDDEIAAAPFEYIMGKGCGHLEKAGLLLESLLLHESVHWVRYRLGLPRRA